MSDDTPSVKLGGQDYAVPQYVLREIKKLMPRLMRAGNVDWNKATEADLEDVFDMVFSAVFNRTRPHGDASQLPQMTRDQFDEQVVTLQEIINAVPVIARQAGMTELKKGAAPQGDKNPSSSTTSAPQSRLQPDGPGTAS